MQKAKRKKKCEWCYETDCNWWSAVPHGIADHHCPGLCGFGRHAYPISKKPSWKIPQLSESPEDTDPLRRMRASSDPQAYCLWPVWTIEWIRAMEQKKEKKIQVIGRINWGPMKCIFQEKLEEWV